MRSRKPIAKLNKPTDIRNAMMKNLAASLIQYESIRTVSTRAKVLSGYMDRLINRAKKNDINAKRYIKALLPTNEAYNKVFDVLIERYKDIPGGYTTRVLELNRVGDNARMARISLVTIKKEEKKEQQPKIEEKEEKKEEEKASEKKTTRRTVVKKDAKETAAKKITTTRKKSNAKQKEETK